MAHAATMKDNTMREKRPFPLLYELFKGVLHFYWVFVMRQTQSPHDPAKVRVHRQTRDTKGVTQHHVCRFPAHPRKLHQILQPWGYFPIKILVEHRPQTNEIFCLRPKEAS